MVCELCAVAKKEVESELLYEDTEIMAVIHLKPAIPGQIIIFPKHHYPIFEQVPDKIVAKMFKIANKLGIALFESLNCHGTNLLISNGVAAGQTMAHFSLNLIPRKEKDGLKLQWEPKKASEEELQTAFLMINEKSKEMHPDLFGREEKQEEFVEEKKRPKEIKLDKQKENYLLKSLKKLP